MLNYIQLLLTLSIIYLTKVMILLTTLTAFSGKRNVTVWRPSVRLSVCLSRLISNVKGLMLEQFVCL